MFFDKATCFLAEKGVAGFVAEGGVGFGFDNHSRCFSVGEGGADELACALDGGVDGRKRIKLRHRKL